MTEPEIDQIISCDEAAKASVEAAKREAEDLVAKAKQEAEAMQSELITKLDEVKENEIAPIVKKGQTQAQETMAQAERYIQRLRDRVALRKAKIIEDFVSEALGEAGL